MPEQLAQSEFIYGRGDIKLPQLQKPRNTRDVANYFEKFWELNGHDVDPMGNFGYRPSFSKEIVIPPYERPHLVVVKCSFENLHNAYSRTSQDGTMTHTVLKSPSEPGHFEKILQINDVIGSIVPSNSIPQPTITHRGGEFYPFEPYSSALFAVLEDFVDLSR